MVVLRFSPCAVFCLCLIGVERGSLVRADAQLKCGVRGSLRLC